MRSAVVLCKGAEIGREVISWLRWNTPVDDNGVSGGFNICGLGMVGVLLRVVGVGVCEKSVWLKERHPKVELTLSLLVGGGRVCCKTVVGPVGGFE